MKIVFFFLYISLYIGLCNVLGVTTREREVILLLFDVLITKSRRMQVYELLKKKDTNPSAVAADGVFVAKKQVSSWGFEKVDLESG